MTRTGFGKGLAAALAVAGLCAASAATSHEGERPERKEIRKIIIEHADGSRKEIEPPSVAVKMIACDDGAGKFETGTETETGADGKQRKTRIVICNRDKGQMLSALERARARLAEQDALAENHRARALARLDAEIARLKADGKPAQ